MIPKLGTLIVNPDRPNLGNSAMRTLCEIPRAIRIINHAR